MTSPEAFAFYRLPGCHNAVFISGLTEYGLRPGFVIQRFDPCKQPITICGKMSEMPVAEASALCRQLISEIFQADASTGEPHLPEATTMEEYFTGASQVAAAIHSGECSKIVYSRILRSDTPSPDIFKCLCTAYPDAYVFCYFTPDTGMWVGASPELLFELRESTLRTMALAGTKAADDTTPWDKKNIEEQAIVTQFITDTLKDCGLTPLRSEPTDRYAGPVKHICTLIRSDVIGGDTPEQFTLLTESLLNALSPTPALAGMPREAAIKVIHTSENFDRNCYGGCCGIFYPSIQACHLWVNLRSMQVSSRGTVLYSGGGYTHLSDPIAEWEETERKSRTLRAFTKSQGYGVEL